MTRAVLPMWSRIFTNAKLNDSVRLRGLNQATKFENFKTWIRDGSTKMFTKSWPVPHFSLIFPRQKLHSERQILCPLCFGSAECQAHGELAKTSRHLSLHLSIHLSILLKYIQHCLFYLWCTYKCTYNLYMFGSRLQGPWIKIEQLPERKQYSWVSLHMHNWNLEFYMVAEQLQATLVRQSRWETTNTTAHNRTQELLDESS